jgi:hypothetical protein
MVYRCSSADLLASTVHSGRENDDVMMLCIHAQGRGQAVWNNFVNDSRQHDNDAH